MLGSIPHIKPAAPKHGPRRLLASALVVALALACGIGNARAAAEAAGKSTVTVTLPGLKCSTSAGSDAFRVGSWSWGATLATSSVGGGSGTSKPNLQSLEVVKGFDACSPVLFGAVATGKPFSSATIVQTDDRGTPLVTVTLTEAVVTTYLVGGSPAQSPGETIRLDFRKICMVEHASNNTVCYDTESPI